MARQYLKTFFVILLAFLFITLAPVLFFSANREYTAIKDVAQIQQTSVAPIIYGSILGRSDTFLYKSYLVNSIKPTVVVLGGSTVLQARQKMFVDSMVNAGQAMNSILDGLQFTPVLISNKPAIVIIGVQPWWFTMPTHNTLRIIDGVVNVPARKVFNRSMIWSRPDLTSYTAPEQISLWDGVKFYQWWIQGKINFKMIYDLFSSHKIQHIGVSARYRKDGYGPDGSYYYTSRVTGFKPISKSDKIEEDINRSWLLNPTINETALNNFLFLIQKLQKADIRTIIYFIPFPPALVNLMGTSSKQFNWITMLKDELRDRGLDFFDYSFDPEISVNDCEFLDGLHGGEITFMRTLVKLSRDSDTITNYINVKYLETAIENFSGNAFVPDRKITKDQEIDFGGRGCPKTNS
jgi:hypothetical protein